MARTSSPSPTAPAAVRLLLLALLPLFAVLLYLDGQHYDHDLLDLQHKPGTSGSAGPFPERLLELPRSGQIRRYTKDNLYEYINGHAEYFIGAGFRGLTVGEYGAAADGQPRLVINLYDMGKALNAFGVLVTEAGGQEPADVGTLGFRSGQGVSFIHGPYYAQVSLFDPTLPALDLAAAMAEALAARGAAGELAFRFPELGQVTATRYVREYYAGMDFLNGVLERSFQRDGHALRAFTLSGSAEQIQGLVQALTGFLAGDGIPFQSEQRRGLDFYRVQDPYEGDWFFVPLPGQLVGVYAPLDDALAQAVLDFAAEPKP